jgi:hypothetical protein
MLYGKPMIRGFFLAACFTIILCSLLYGWQIWENYIHISTVMAANLHLHDQNMSNIRAAAIWLLSNNPGAIQAITYLFSALGLICIIAIGWKAKNASRETQDMGFALILPVSALCSPYLYYHSTILQAITIYFIYCYSGKAIIYVVLIINIITSILSFTLSQYGDLPVARFFIIAQLVLVLWSAYLFSRLLVTNHLPLVGK